MTVGREYPERPVVGVGGVVISEGHTLLIRRSGPPLQGEWSIPGGTLETGETMREGVRRELREETGVDVRVGEMIEVFERIFPDAQGRSQYHFVILDFLCEFKGGVAKAASDVIEVTWAAKDELEGFHLTPTALRVIRKAFEMWRESGAPSK